MVFIDNLRDIALVKNWLQRLGQVIVPYTIDRRLGHICFEVNGQYHYNFSIQERRHLIEGTTKMKRRFLQKIGFAYVEIPFHAFDGSMFKKSNQEQLRKIVQTQLQKQERSTSGKD